MSLVVARILNTTDAPDDVQVPGHDGHSARVDGHDVDILEQSDQVRLGRLLERLDGRHLPAERLQVQLVPDLADESGEWQLAQQQVSRLLEFFFQAEDGIRDYKVTGVQTCALPI